VTGSGETIDVQEITVASLTLVNGRAYALRFKTSARDGSNNVGFWEHVQGIHRSAGGAVVSTEVLQLTALDTEFAAVVVSPEATAVGTQLQALGEDAKTITWTTQIFIESDMAVM
jgi:hypothetical protein